MFKIVKICFVILLGLSLVHGYARYQRRTFGSYRRSFGSRKFATGFRNSNKNNFNRFKGKWNSYTGFKRRSRHKNDRTTTACPDCPSTTEVTCPNPPCDGPDFPDP